MDLKVFNWAGKTLLFLKDLLVENINLGREVTEKLRPKFFCHLGITSDDRLTTNSDFFSFRSFNSYFISTFLFLVNLYVVVYFLNCTTFCHS